MRRIAVALALTALFATCASAASPTGSGRIAYIRDGWIFTSELDGTAERQIASSGTPGFLGSPIWSPDGRRLAFIKRITGSDSVPVVVDLDGRNEVQLAARGQYRVACWLDSSRFVAFDTFVESSDPNDVGNDAYLVDADARSIRRLTSNGSLKFMHYQGCAPDGSAIAFVRDEDDRHVAYVVAVDGSSRRITPDGVDDSPPAWSPTGSKLAFVRGGRLYTANPNGSEAAQIGRQDHPVGPLAWSPDGTQIVFSTSYTDYTRCDRYYCVTVQEPYMINADGTAERELRTKVQGQWSWSPDGTKLATSGPHVVNVDGSCPTKLSSSPRTDSAFWQPIPGGPASAPLRCADLSLSTSRGSFEATFGDLVGYTLTVTNTGNEAASWVELTHSGDVLVESADPGRGSCNFDHCSLGRLAPEASVRINVLARVIEASAASSWRARAPEPDGFLDDNTATVYARGTNCTDFGTAGNDVLYGTIGDDLICGRGGADRIFGRDGRDELHGSDGPDTISGGPGRDLLDGASERDVLLARDGYRDVVKCGSQYDIAVVDRLDVVARSCERVYRPPARKRRRG
jgi:Tol biopolymer transport system component